MLPSMQRNFAEVIKLRVLQWEDYPGFSRWAQCNHKHPYKKEARVSGVTGRDVITEAEVREGERLEHTTEGKQNMSP